jgi:amidophosphoribosyltransferase
VRSNAAQPIQDIFAQINERINNELELRPEIKNDVAAQKKHIPYIGELLMGHVRYGTFGKNSIEAVHPFLRQNNWMHRNLIMAGNFNMTNVNDLFAKLVELGQHPKDKADTVTVMEKVGHFQDRQVSKLYKKFKSQGLSKIEASPKIAEELDVAKILKKSARDWDGGYAMGGLMGHGDAFLLRDPAGIRPAYYYQDDEVVVVASERPVIQTAFDTKFEEVHELDPGKAIIIKKNGEVSLEQITRPLERKACSFERIYFSRGSDAEIYQERKKLGKLLFPQIMDAIDHDIDNTVFSYIPNTAETCFYGMVEEGHRVQDKQKFDAMIAGGGKLSREEVDVTLSRKLRTEKIAIKDAKLRTFITEDSSRDDLVAHVYDVTYGVVKPDDNLVIIDDSIVRGTTLQKSILKMMDRLKPQKIVVVSSAPQIRYPDCYGIDMARLETLIAFRAALELHRDRGTYNIVEDIYQKCKSQLLKPDKKMKNEVQALYDPFTDQEISDKIAELLTDSSIKAEVKIIYQTVDNLHEACPKNLGDWYFTGNYPTAGGNRVVNQAYVNFFEGNKERAY